MPFTTKDQAAQEAYEYFHDNIRPLPQHPDGSFDLSNGVAHNNDVDAFRHAYASAVFTYEFGELLAQALGDGNEFFSGNQPEEINMDKWNNSEGRDIGNEALGNPGVNDTNYKSHIGSTVESELANGSLITDINDTRQFNGTTLTTQQIWDAFTDALEMLGSEAASALQTWLDDLGGAFDNIPNGFGPFGGTSLNEAIGNAADDFLGALSIATPLVIDLDNDGFHFTDIANGSDAFFDLKGNQFAVNTSWNETGDGFLAKDNNDNGRIDNVTELFGANGGTTAWQKLAALDSNSDNVINASDTNWADLRIWKDANGNGFTDAEELKALSAHNITTISLQQNSDTSVVDGQTLSGNATVTVSGGATRGMTDVFFTTNPMNSWFVGDGSEGSTEADPETLFLPLSRGYGTLPALHAA